MTKRDIPAGERLCRASGWNQLQRDWLLLFESNPEGCRVAVDDGQIVGTVASLTYENRFAWLSMVLVDPRNRRNGIGTTLFEEGLALAGKATCVRLDATEAGRQIYRRYGFKDEYSISRMTYKCRELAAMEPYTRGRRICSEDLSRILELDRSVFGADRAFVLRALFARSPEYAWLIGDSDIKGYCFGRDGFLYDQLGPIVAVDERVAQSLVQCCLATRERLCMLDAPEHSSAWLEWLQMRGFTKERSFTRMFRGNNKFPGDLTRVFGIAGPELG